MLIFSRAIEIQWLPLLALATGIFLGGCQLPRVSSNYVLNHFDDLVVTNNLAFPETPRRTGPKSLRFAYPLLIKNSSKTVSYEIALDQVVLKFKQAQVPAQCTATAHGDANNLSLAPGATYLIKCKIVLVADDKIPLDQRDESAFLLVPYRTTGASTTQKGISVKLYFKMEDFT